ncbi:MAG TPA: hypothetical protein VHP63_07645, partial [candidate division Zixibacteria bacterium]|nr:hypothetical protein [candidate division Zixibacteria bacterium]
MGLHKILRFNLNCISCIILFSSMMSVASTPEYCIRQHNIGKLVFGVTNYGLIGRSPARDCFTNEKILLSEFPKGSNTIHLYRAGLWVGAVAGRDTLVSTVTEQNSRVREFNPDVPPFGDILFRSNIDPDLPDYDKAVSEQDFISIFTDTFTTGVPDLGFDAVDFRGHRPLGIEVTQSSYAWSYAYTEDFVLFNYTIKNIGEKFLKDAYIGIYMDADVHPAGSNAALPVLNPFSPFKPPTGGSEDLTGFVKNYNRTEGVCDITYNLNLAWTADNDGDSQGPNWLAPNAIGMRYLGRPSKFQLSYNWWIFEASGIYDFGPQHKNQVRNLGNGFGSPIGDRNKYFLLSNGEQDYDQAYASSISIFNSTWVRPDPRRSLIWSTANDNQWL